MKITLKENVFIEGFNSISELYNRPCEICIEFGNFSILYEGESQNISEEIASKCVGIDHELSYWNSVNEIIYLTYDEEISSCFCFAKDSINSACKERYCIVYESKK